METGPVLGLNLITLWENVQAMLSFCVMLLDEV